MTGMGGEETAAQLPMEDLQAVLNELAAMLMLSKHDFVKQELLKMQGRLLSQLVARAPTAPAEAAPAAALAPAAPTAASAAAAPAKAQPAQQEKPEELDPKASVPWTEILGCPPFKFSVS